MQGTRFGIVKNAEVQCKRQRRGVPKLEQRPGNGTTKKDSTGYSAYVATAAIDVGNQLFKLGVILRIGVRWRGSGAHIDFPWYFFRVCLAGNERLPDCTARLAAAGRRILLINGKAC